MCLEGNEREERIVDSGEVKMKVGSVLGARGRLNQGSRSRGETRQKEKRNERQVQWK